jgi:hypothetical protein
MARTPVLPEATPVGPLPAQRRNSMSPVEALLRARRPSPDIGRRLVLAETDIKPCVAVGCQPSRSIGDFGDKLRLDPVNAGKNERRAEARAARRWDAQRRRRAGFVVMRKPDASAPLPIRPEGWPHTRH